MTRDRAVLVLAALALLGALAVSIVGAAGVDRVDRLTAELRCPVCQGLSVKDSPSQTAREIRALVAERVAQGRSDEDIREEFRRSYGDWVFLSPDPAGPGLLIWLAPLALLAAGAAIAWSRVRTGATA